MLWSNHLAHLNLIMAPFFDRKFETSLEIEFCRGFVVHSSRPSTGFPFGLVELEDLYTQLSLNKKGPQHSKPPNQTTTSQRCGAESSSTNLRIWHEKIGNLSQNTGETFRNLGKHHLAPTYSRQKYGFLDLSLLDASFIFWIPAKRQLELTVTSRYHSNCSVHDLGNRELYIHKYTCL